MSHRFLTYIFSAALVLSATQIAFGDVIIGNIKFTDDGKIVFSDNSEQGTATLKGADGLPGPKGDKGDPGTPGSQVTRDAMCEVYAAEGSTSPSFCGKRIVFVTSQQFNGNLGGLAGADQKCQDAATSGSLPGIYKAWLSDANTAAKDRLTHSSVPYVRPDDAIIANNWFDLTDGWLKEVIACDEFKNCTYSSYPNQYIYTNSKKDGSIGGTDTFTPVLFTDNTVIGPYYYYVKHTSDCDHFTSSATSETINTSNPTPNKTYLTIGCGGGGSVTDLNYTALGDTNGLACFRLGRLICIQQ